MVSNQVAQDINFIQAALEHALTYGSTFDTMSQMQYNEAQAELMQAIEKLKRIRRNKNGTVIGNTDFTNSR